MKKISRTALLFVTTLFCIPVPGLFVSYARAASVPAAGTKTKKKFKHKNKHKKDKNLKSNRNRHTRKPA